MGVTTTGNPPAEPRPRRPHLSRLRTAAAGSVLAAVSITGVGAAAPASAAELRSFLAPLDYPGADIRGNGEAASGSIQADGRASDSQRLLGIRQDLANAVAWGSVTQRQADQFYTQMQSRIARGL